VDFRPDARDTREVSALGSPSQRLAGVLNAAFAEGLLSERTHSYRLGLLFESGLVDRGRLVGDLKLRRDRGAPAADAWRALVQTARGLVGRAGGEAPFVLSLQSLESDRVLVGRHPRCDIVVDDPNVSRRHAELLFRDGVWVIRDLGSTNGTSLNGELVGRSTVRPGDILGFAEQFVQLD
jgi:FHA domain